MTSRKLEKHPVETTPYDALAELYQALFERATEGVFITNGQGHFIEVNPYGCEMLGYTHAEILNLSWSDIIPEEEQGQPLHPKELQAGQTALNERWLRGKDSRLRPVEINTRLLSDGSLLGLVRDIAERKQAERSITLLNFALDNIHEAAFLIDETAHFYYVNGEACRALGYTRAELLGLSVADVDPDFPPDRWPDHWRNLKAQQSLTFEGRHKTKEGRLIPVEISANYFEYEGQGYNLDLVHDITERKQAEAERQAHLHFFASLDQVNRAIQGTNDLEQLMYNVLDVLLDIFECDRAWLVHPCDPEAATWQTPMERTRPEYPGVLSVGVKLPLDPVGAAVFQILRDNPGPVTFEPESPHQVPEMMTQIFNVQSFIAVALYPKVGKPWSFGLHQCSYPRVWSPEDQRLFQEIARRLTDALTSLLVYRTLQENEKRYRTFVNHAADAFYLHDAGGAILDVNRQACESLGYSHEELIGMTPYNFDATFDHSFLEQMEARLDAGEVIAIDTRHRRKDGSVFPVEVRVRPFWQGERRFSVSLARDVTEHKRVEEALRESEFFLRKSQAVARIGSYYLDARTGQWISSPALDVIFGIDERFPKDVNGWIELIHPEHKDEMIQYLTQQVMTEHQRFDKEYRIVRQNDQQERWVHGLGELEFDEYGNAIKMIGTIQDITERKAAEKALQLTRFSMESVADAVYWINPEARIIEVNKAAGEMLGYTHDELCRLSLADIDPGFSIAQWFQTWEAIQTTGKGMIESMHRTKTGRLIPVEIIANFIKYGDQELDCAVVRDITERKQAESQLQTSEARYRALVESQVDLISRYLPDTTLTFVNDAYCHFYGKKREELIGFSYLTMVAPEFHEQALKETENFVKDPRLISGEYLNYRWDGKECWIHWILQGIVDDNGRVIEIQASGRDITPLKQAEEEIHRLNEELEQRVIKRTAQLEAANNELEAFSYSVSHDLRAPLRHIDGFLEILEKRIAASLDERSQHYMNTISDSAKRMGQLIDDLLSFSRMGRNEMSHRLVNLDTLVQEIVRQLEPETQGRAIHWHITNLPIVTGDQAMLRLVLVNLLSNALKFTRGCPQVEIEVGQLPSQDGEIVIFIRDNGVGFDMAYADKLFGVFQRLHRADEFEGTGIGLANVRRIIHRHGGRTWAKGKINQGATFFFSLPQSIQGA